MDSSFGHNAIEQYIPRRGRLCIDALKFVRDSNQKGFTSIAAARERELAIVIPTTESESPAMHIECQKRNEHHVEESRIDAPMQVGLRFGNCRTQLCNASDERGAARQLDEFHPSRASIDNTRCVDDAPCAQRTTHKRFKVDLAVKRVVDGYTLPRSHEPRIE